VQGQTSVKLFTLVIGQRQSFGNSSDAISNVIDELNPHGNAPFKNFVKLCAHSFKRYDFNRTARKSNVWRSLKQNRRSTTGVASA
jgi:hypothetical protein